MEALLPYYERELAFLRQYSREFAERYPKIASHLATGGEQSDDPHVERMIDSFALLGARINKKLADEYPEFTEALLEVLYPHYLRPFPSCSIAQFGAQDVEGAKDAEDLEHAHRVATIARGTLLETRELRGVRCRFRTAYDVAIAPVRIADAQYTPLGALGPEAAVLPGNASGVLSFTFETTSGVDFSAIGLDTLRAYLHGEQSFIAALADCLFINASAAYVETGTGRRWTPLAAVPVAQAGFADDEALIDFPAKSHSAYRLLTEYFAFPDKFNFIDFDLGAMLRASERCMRITLHVVLGEMRGEAHLARLIETLARHHLRLFCTPVVNLFAQRGEPIHVSHEAVSYPVLAAARRADAYEVYSIDRVHLVKECADTQSMQTVTEFRPFYALHHDELARTGRYWFARRDDEVARVSPGYETEISLVDADFEPGESRTDTLSLALTCTNRDWPAALAIGLEGGDLFVEETHGADDTPGTKRAGPIAMLSRPTPSVRVPRGPLMHWRLVAHLALNHVSLAEQGLAALKEILVLYDLRRSAVSARHIEGLVGIEQRGAVQWLPGQPFATFVRGMEIRVTVDEANFVGTSLASFVRVLDTFFGLYVHLNSFVQLVAVSKRTGEEIMRCKPRSAESMLA
ncbi:type VI secretion system baseplate subunit TssF [Trinickia fusca]|uniref:Type VI secretion system baseplate subunit TssF n=1 Tax=Trinickia fusca TaxID=2419777 RepID=A0A494XJS6_9BURK|nr:type VI secretion system baseplate subunit TssF [Trinickia fusca]RKP50975.1 type VI secretion system baseplate subunit TssF [Trinickia fusca]